MVGGVSCVALHLLSRSDTCTKTHKSANTDIMKVMKHQFLKHIPLHETSFYSMSTVRQAACSARAFTDATMPIHTATQCGWLYAQVSCHLLASHHLHSIHAFLGTPTLPHALDLHLALLTTWMISTLVELPINIYCCIWSALTCGPHVHGNLQRIDTMGKSKATSISVSLPTSTGREAQLLSLDHCVGTRTKWTLQLVN